MDPDAIRSKLSKLPFSTYKSLQVVDSHTCGQPTRVILCGTGLQPGTLPTDGQIFLAEKAPWVRRTVVLEPRGHRSMFGAALIPPHVSTIAASGESGESGQEATWGVVFMDAEKYPDMCGHATIGTATTLVEMGLVQAPVTDGSFTFKLHAPAGLIRLEVTMSAGRCQSVGFETPLAYFVGSIEIDVKKEDGTSTKATVDVTYGGQYYGFIPSTCIDLSIEPDNIDDLVLAARKIRTALAASTEMQKLLDTRTNLIPEVGNIVWTDTPRHPDSHARNVPVSAADSYDRSPCGTATCARMAALYAQGKLSLGEDFMNESILGTQYRGRVLARNTPVEEGGHEFGIVPQVTGSAWITSCSTLLVDERDPLGGGYLIGGGKAVL